MKRTTDYHQRAAEIIQSVQYATLATVTPEGLPWNSPVFALHDNEGAIYWVSDKEGQHSKNVRHNAQVFIVIYNSTVPGGAGEGVYVQADVSQLEDPEEIRLVRRMKKGRTNDDPAPFMGDGIRRVYKAIPRKIWMNDAQIERGVFIRDYRVELSLDKLKRRLKGAQKAA